MEDLPVGSTPSPYFKDAVSATPRHPIPTRASGDQACIKIAEVEDLRQQVQRLESKVGFQKTMLEGYREKIYGQPVQWPEKILPQYKEEQFQANISKAIDESEASVEITTFDCKEPPCIAALRVLPGGKSNLRLSEAWSKNYGANISSNYSGSIDCGDGREERVLFLSPAGDGQIDPGKMTKEEFWKALTSRKRTDEDRNRSKRIQARWEELRESWVCLPKNP